VVGVDCLPGSPSCGHVRLGLSAVIEEERGMLSYWALKHPTGRPDFHHPDAFALELAWAEAASSRRTMKRT
jgi:hypothetical protein